ncbi:MAG: 5'-3' exonuclease [Candidatus Levyibacteriota bacterium]
MQEDLQKQIFLVIDGSAIVHRAYHAMPALTAEDGTPTGAVHGFFSMLLKLIQELSPSHIAVAFDRPKPTFRQELYKEYQAQRPTTASDLSPQFGIIINILKEAHIPVYAVDGFEADDIIGTLSEAAKKVGDISYIVTGDRDMMQLVNGRTKVLMPIKGISEMKLYDTDRVKEQFGVTPDKIVELKALQGDASDNYPGVTGIGPKTAAGLVEEYGSVEEIYNHLEDIKKKNLKLYEKLAEGKDHAILGHQLATILTSVPFEYNFDDCSMENISYKDWRRAFDGYNFKTLPKRLDEVFGKGKNEEGKKNPNQMKLL